MHDRGVQTKEVEPAVLGAAPLARRDDDRVRIDHLLDRSGPDQSRGVKGGAVREVHRLTFRQLLADIVEEQLGSHSLVKDRRGHARSDPSHPHDAELHNPSRASHP